MCKLILTYDLFGENSEKITQIIQNNTIFNIHSINGVYFDLIKMLHNIKKSKQNIQENLLEVNEHIENNYINYGHLNAKIRNVNLEIIVKNFDLELTLETHDIQIINETNQQVIHFNPHVERIIREKINNVKKYDIYVNICVNEHIITN